MAGEQRYGAQAGFTQSQLEEIQRIARQEVDRSWAEVGVDTTTFTGRQQHASLLLWTRERRTKLEAGISKIGGAFAVSIVTALVTAGVTYLTGRHQ